MMYGLEYSARAYIAFLVGVALAGWVLVEGVVWLFQHITIGLR